MEEKVALIIGGSGGIGLETAKTLSKQGFKICLTYYRNDSKLKKYISEKNSVNYFNYQMDLADEENTKDTVSKILQEQGRIDVVVHCAAVPFTNKNIFDLNWEDFQQQLDVQIKGLFTVVKSLSPLILKNQRIKFIAVSTEYCFGKPPTMLSHYVAPKYALMGLMKSLCSELTANNCTFNMVSPGMVDTPLLDHLHPKIREAVAFKNPMKRIAQAAEVAEVISFLVSEKAEYLNGVNIPINGGNVLT